MTDDFFLLMISYLCRIAIDYLTGTGEPQKQKGTTLSDHSLFMYSISVLTQPKTGY
jgi:hypothetical protein